MPNPDARQFEALIEPHLDALFRAAFRLSRNKADAEDLVQETCVRAYARLTQLHEPQHAKAWLLRVLHNLFVDGARRTRLAPQVAAGAEEPHASAASPDLDPEGACYAAQREERLHRAWLRLDRGQRTLLALRAEGYSLPEIADITGLAMDALTARLFRARRSLARYLMEQQEPASGLQLEIVK